MSKDRRGSRFAWQRCYHALGSGGQSAVKMAEQGIGVKFWGVRGSIPVSGPETRRGGGNTACVEVRCGDRIVVLDAGSGIREAGMAYAAQGVKELDILLSHAHWDHLIGLPFFKPLYKSGMTTRIWSGHLATNMTARQIVEDLMRAPFLPMSPKVFCNTVDYRDFEPGADLDLGDGIRVRTRKLNHPGGAVGYRLHYGGRVLAYITDTEDEPGSVSESNILTLIAGADLVIYDCTYTDEELNLYKGYGHSTWQKGVKLCLAAKAKRLAIFHHDPSRTDDQLDEIEANAKAAFAGAFAARDGMTLEI